MHKELEVMKPRCNGLWKRCTGTAAFVYFGYWQMCQRWRLQKMKKAMPQIPG